MILLGLLHWLKNCGWHIWGRDKNAGSDSESLGNKNYQDSRCGLASCPSGMIVPSRQYFLAACFLVPQPFPFLAQYSGFSGTQDSDTSLACVSLSCLRLFSKIFPNKGWFHSLYIIGVLAFQGPDNSLKDYLGGYILGHPQTPDNSICPVFKSKG